MRRSLLSEVDGELTGDFLRNYLLPSDFRFLLMPCLIEIGCDDEAEGYISLRPEGYVIGEESGPSMYL